MSFVEFQLILLKIGGLVHPQLGLLCGAALPGAFFQTNSTFYKKTIFVCDIQIIFNQNGPNLLSTRRTITESGILDPLEF